MDKLGAAKAFAKAGNWDAALKMAAKIKDFGPLHDDICRAASAIASPDFYSQIGVDINQAKTIGIEALKERYSL